MDKAEEKASERYTPIYRQVPLEMHGENVAQGRRREGYATCYREEVEKRDAEIADLKDRILDLEAGRELKDLAMVDKIMEVVEQWLMHDGIPSYDRLRTRLTEMLLHSKTSGK